MALAGMEVRRLKKNSGVSLDPLQWTEAITTDQVNEAVVQITLEKEHRIEPPHPAEAEMGFGVRAVNSGRTWVYETSRWREPVIDLEHAKTTDENRRKVLADFAVIVGVGAPDEDTKIFAKTHPVRFLVGDELKSRLPIPPPPVDVPPGDIPADTATPVMALEPPADNPPAPPSSAV